MAFRNILRGLCVGTDVVRAAVFCDEEGERVEGIIDDNTLDTYDLDIAGASFASLAPALMEQGPRARMRFCHDDGVIWMQMLTHGYYLIVLTRRGPLEARLAHQLDGVAEALVAHM